ncbi:MAG: peptidoglycan-binding protein [Dehalococcoidia bacterium]
MRVLRAAVVVVIAVAVLAGGVYAYDRWLSDDDSAEARPLVTAPVERRTVRQTVVTRGTVAFAPAATLLAASPGRVTGVHVAIGTVLEPGMPVVSVNGRPAVAMAGGFPFWRDLAEGDEGADVTQLETALAAEGYHPGPVDTDFTFATEAALEDWQAAHGFPVDGAFQAGDAFVGAWPARVGAVRVGIGDFVSPGSALVSTSTQELEVTVQLAPTQRLRVKAGQEVIVELTANRTTVRGILGEPTEAPAATGGGPPGAQGQDQGPSYVAKVTLDGDLGAVDGAQVSATILLAEVPDALVVPIGAIVQDGQGGAAVQVQSADGSVHVVSITTGLSEGAFVEVKSGLQGGETVLLEQR